MFVSSIFQHITKQLHLQSLNKVLKSASESKYIRITKQASQNIVIKISVAKLNAYTAPMETKPRTKVMVKSYPKTELELLTQQK